MATAKPDPKHQQHHHQHHHQRNDYCTLYLVTDSTPAVLGLAPGATEQQKEDRVCATVEAALRGGATCVQLRDKDGDTAALVRTARRLHAVARRFRVPLMVNDRVDVALAVGCEGVHVGQDDLGESRLPFCFRSVSVSAAAFCGGRAHCSYVEGWWDVGLELNFQL